jgi:benzylsuccinate CoA-transferase BbsF subunit
VFITNLGKELIAPAGLAYSEVQKLKPDIIMVWQPGFGIEGPYATYKAFGGMLQSVTGMCEISGFPGELPGGAGTAFCDYPSSMYALMLISAALDQRRRTGVGTFIEIPLYEVGVTNVGLPLVDYMANGRIPSRQGNHHPFASPHGAYPCKGEDRWCVITVFTEDEWRQFCDAVGRPKWKEESKFATLVDRLRNEDELDRLIAEWTGNYTVEEVMARMDKAGVPVGIVMKGEDLSEDSHLKERGFYLEFEYHAPPMTVGSPVAGKSVAMRVPMLLSETPPRFGPISRMGEDNEYVYGQIVGLSAEEIKHLTEEGVFT